MARAFLILSLSLHLLLSHDASAQTAYRFPPELDRYIENVLESWNIPGIAIAVVRNDSTLVAKGYGIRELGKPDRVDGNTVFDIGSLAMGFTATAAGVLVDRGELRWDDPVQRWLPRLVLPSDTLTGQATLRDFLSHRTGIDPATTLWFATALERDEVLRRIRHLRTIGPFRRTMIMSNIGYTVAGEAAAVAARTPLEAMLRELLIKPIGLTSTTWTYGPRAGMANAAALHATVANQQQVIARELQQPVAAAIGLQSTASDLARWMRLHLNHGMLDGKRYVSDSVMRAMHSIQVPIRMTSAQRAARLMQDTVIGYGMGWQIADYRGHRMVWHTGNSNGHGAYIALFPDDRLGIVVMVNTRSAFAAPGTLVNRIADTYLGFEPRDWAAEEFARRPVADSIRGVNQRALIAMRSGAPPRAPLAAYAGRYDHSVFGPIRIRQEGTGLTLQMADGQIGDLEYHGGDAFYILWRDPLFREVYGAHVSFTMVGNSAIALTTFMGRDQFTARKSEATVSAPRSPTPDLTNVDAIVGRWNLRMLGSAGSNDVYSSWLEVERSGFESLVGRWVGLIGGPRPIGRIEWIPNPGIARFNVATEWEVLARDYDITTRDLQIEVRPSGDSISGVLIWPVGVMRAFVGRRAPALLRDMPASWSAPVPLFNGQDLTGWTVAPTARSLPNFWTVRDGVLVNTGNEGANLMTIQKYRDFKVHAEFRLPKGGTSAVFPRGRYWVIISDRADTIPFHGTTGAVHKFLVPNQNAYLGPDVWQTIDITMVGRRITIAVNGKTVIADQIVAGVTGSAIDTDEAAPGPIMLQGEETRVEFRNITISVPSER